MIDGRRQEPFPDELLQPPNLRVHAALRRRDFGWRRLPFTASQLADGLDGVLNKAGRQELLHYWRQYKALRRNCFDKRAPSPKVNQRTLHDQWRGLILGTPLTCQVDDTVERIMGREALFGALVTVVVIAGCANPGIVQLSPDTYMLSRTDHAGIFGNAAANKAKVIREANAFAASKGKVAIPLSSNEVPLGNGPGQFASFEYEFRVVDSNDPEARHVNPISTTVTPYASGQGSTVAPVAQILQRAGTAMQEAPLLPYKQQCRNFGFAEGTPEFAQCVQRQYNAAQPARPIVCTANPVFLTCEQ